MSRLLDLQCGLCLGAVIGPIGIPGIIGQRFIDHTRLHALDCMDGARVDELSYINCFGNLEDVFCTFHIDLLDQLICPRHDRYQARKMEDSPDLMHGSEQ